MNQDPQFLVSAAFASGEMRLYRVRGFDGRGLPALEGATQPVLLTLAPQPVPAHDLIAVCRETAEGQIVVLGYASPATLTPSAAPEVAPQITQEDDRITLGIGRAEIVLHADGRVRIKGDDIRIESHGKLGLGGAVIDLN